MKIADEPLSKIGCSAPDVDGEEEHQVHHQQEDRQTQPAIQDDPVEPLGQPVRLRLLVVADRRTDLADQPVARIDDRQLGLLAAALARLFQGGGRQAQRRAVEDVAFQRL